LDWTSRFLGFLFKPRGKPIPPGEYWVSEPEFSAINWPDEPVIFKLETYSAEDVPLGNFVAIGDRGTVCSIAGRRVDMRGLLDAIGEEQDLVRVVAAEGGRLSTIEMK
jgi:hypothetical protein